MGATSVTGTGSGIGVNKGSEHWNIGVHRLIGPRVVGCGDIVLDASGFGTVVYPQLPLYSTFTASDLYCPFLSTNDATAPYFGDFTITSFTVTGGADADLCWQIVKKGIWGSLENDQASTEVAKW